MLKSWSIENFKPIVNSGELKLAPVTVLAGRNSSGKSSLLQSILMIAQTLSNPLPERALLPNGPIVQLGTFEDILSTISGLRELTIQFEISNEREMIGPNILILMDHQTTKSLLPLAMVTLRTQAFPQLKHQGLWLKEQLYIFDGKIMIM